MERDGTRRTVTLELGTRALRCSCNPQLSPNTSNGNGDAALFT